MVFQDLLHGSAAGIVQSGFMDGLVGRLIAFFVYLFTLKYENT